MPRKLGGRKRKDYDVGYGKPPEDTQFKKGVSGNRKGRPPGSKNFKTELRQILNETVPVRAGGRASNVATIRALLMRLKADGLAGKIRQLEKLLDLAERYDLEDADNATEAELSQSEAEILERYRERIIGEHERTKAQRAEDDAGEGKP